MNTIVHGVNTIVHGVNTIFHGVNYRLDFASLKILPGFSEVSGSVFRFSIPPFPNPVFQPVSPESATAMDIPSRAHEKIQAKN